MAKIRRTPEQWQQILDDQPQSGLSVTEYCFRHHISTSRFYLWRKRLDEKMKRPGASQDWVSLVDAPVVAEPAIAATHEEPVTHKPWQIELVLPGGVVLRMRHSD